MHNSPLLTSYGCSGTENGHNEGGLRAGYIRVTVLRIDIARGEKLAPVWHGQNASYGTSIIAKEYACIQVSAIGRAMLKVVCSHTSEGDEETDEDSWPCSALRLIMLDSERHDCGCEVASEHFRHQKSMLIENYLDPCVRSPLYNIFIWTISTCPGRPFLAPVAGGVDYVQELVPMLASSGA